MNATAQNQGPLGQERGVGFVIVLSLVTLGIYTIYWFYKGYDEAEETPRRRVNGIVGVLLVPRDRRVLPAAASTSAACTAQKGTRTRR